jgi:phosphate starvation-inducible protein PhoH
MLLEINSKTLNELTDAAQLIHFSKSEKKRKRSQQIKDQFTTSSVVQKQNLSLRTIKPITENQSIAFSNWKEGQNLLLHGLAGTGKSYISESVK